MLRFLPKSLRIALGLSFAAIGTVLSTSPVFLLAPFKYLLPFKGWRRFWSRAMDFFPEQWPRCLLVGLALMGRIEWDVTGAEALTRKDWYLVMCNHQSWTDIAVLYIIFRSKIPFLKFFLKRQLIWVPFAGLACWLMGYPFVYRYDKKFLRKHPEKKGKDFENTKKACERYKDYPIAIMNFPEGTRLTAAKQETQSSPYKHLLIPKSGGLAYTLEAMQGMLKNLLDVTIIYPGGKPTFGEFFAGECKKIIVRVEQLPIDERLIGNFQKDREFRKRFQAFLNDRWEKKDKLIDELL